MAHPLRDKIIEAIHRDAQAHPVSGMPNREHWWTILDRHAEVDGMCAVCFRPEGYLEPEGWPCPDVLALVKRLDGDGYMEES